jgi:tetratricopeptide (TPR) repeat protein
VRSSRDRRCAHTRVGAQKGKGGILPADVIPDFDALWDYSDPAGTEARFVRLLPRVEAVADQSLLAELLSQIARAQGFQRRFDKAGQSLRRAEATRDEISPRAYARVLLEMGRIEHASGMPGSGESRFRAALAAAERAGEQALAIDAAHMLGIVTSLDEQIEWNLRAIDVAQHSPDPRVQRWLGTLYSNLAWTHHDAGRLNEALRLFRVAEAWIQEHGDAGQNRKARWRVARCQRSLGAVDEALATQQQLLRECERAGEQDGDVLRELGELLLMRGDDAAASAMLRRAFEVLSRDPWRLTENEAADILRLERSSESASRNCR